MIKMKEKIDFLLLAKYVNNIHFFCDIPKKIIKNKIKYLI